MAVKSFTILGPEFTIATAVSYLREMFMKSTTGANVIKLFSSSSLMLRFHPHISLAPRACDRKLFAAIIVAVS